MARRHRSLVPPAILILAITGGGTGCDSRATRERKAAEARQRQAEEAARNQAWEDGQRREAETAAPTTEVQKQVKDATYAFMEAHHPDLLVEGVTYTPLTPNLFLVGVAVKDLTHENRYVAQLTAERLRDVAWGEDGEARENGGLLWVVDYADPGRMKEMAERHGFQSEVERIRQEDPDGRYRTGWGRRSWLDDYLLWHFLFNRPRAYGYASATGFAPLAPGYRFHDPTRPFAPEDARRFQAAAAPTGGRSMVFLGGSAWRPPLVSTPRTLSGDAYLAGANGSIARSFGNAAAARGYSGGKSGLGSVSRGGFGAAGHASGSGG